MANIRYRRGGSNAADMAVYSRMMQGDNSAELLRMRQHLARAMREELTGRQREVLLLYYDERLNMREISDRLGVERSSISRTIKRGEHRLRRCLRYGAASFLKDDD